MPEGYWNGLPTKVRRVTGRVPPHDPELHPEYAWWAGRTYPMEEATLAAFGVEAQPAEDLQGQRIQAVEVTLDGVNFGGGVCYLDDRDGAGWHKVTAGRGSPRWGHREVPLVDVEVIEANDDQRGTP